MATAARISWILLAVSVAVASLVIDGQIWISNWAAATVIRIDFMGVLSDSERYGERWVQRMAGSMAVPAMVAHAAGSMDPYLRETRTILDGIKNRIPVCWRKVCRCGELFGATR